MLNKFPENFPAFLSLLSSRPVEILRMHSKQNPIEIKTSKEATSSQRSQIGVIDKTEKKGFSHIISYSDNTNEIKLVL